MRRGMGSMSVTGDKPLGRDTKRPRASGDTPRSLEHTPGRLQGREESGLACRLVLGWAQSYKVSSAVEQWPGRGREGQE